MKNKIKLMRKHIPILIMTSRKVKKYLEGPYRLPIQHSTTNKRKILVMYNCSIKYNVEYINHKQYYNAHVVL